MSPDDAGPARVVRWTGARWEPVGPVLPPLDDPALHDDHAHQHTSWWHLPTGIARPGDRLVARERAWEFLDRCGPRHPAVHRLAEHWQIGTAELLAQRDVWSMRPVVMR